MNVAFADGHAKAMCWNQVTPNIRSCRRSDSTMTTIPNVDDR
ncbi:MAG: hypothetical protein IT210_11555 [Armatimonadetes bacterium]|nr:hypothetical protein [Armatimonadota bacterium]